MDYEVFYQDFQRVEKEIREKLQHSQRCFRNLNKNSEKGDLKKLNKDIEDLNSLLAEMQTLSGIMQEAASDFDSTAYFESGEFAQQMVGYCRQQGVDIKGEAITYEMFPFKIRIDTENQDVYVNRRKVPCVRPLQFVRDMKRSVEKYTKSPFNLSQFVNELAAAYDLTVIVRNSKTPGTVRAGSDVMLKDIYAYLAPTAKARKEYDMQNFAFDLARLYPHRGEERAKDGRRMEFGSSKQPNKLIRILDQDDKEQFLATVRFYEEQVE